LRRECAKRTSASWPGVYRYRGVVAIIDSPNTVRASRAEFELLRRLNDPAVMKRSRSRRIWTPTRCCSQISFTGRAPNLTAAVRVARKLAGRPADRRTRLRHERHLQA